jgi:hypothetical protein
MILWCCFVLSCLVLSCLVSPVTSSVTPSSSQSSTTTASTSASPSPSIPAIDVLRANVVLGGLTASDFNNPDVRNGFAQETASLLGAASVNVTGYQNAPSKQLGSVIVSFDAFFSTIGLASTGANTLTTQTAQLVSNLNVRYLPLKLAVSTIEISSTQQFTIGVTLSATVSPSKSAFPAGSSRQPSPSPSSTYIDGVPKLDVVSDWISASVDQDIRVGVITMVVTFTRPSNNLELCPVPASERSSKCSRGVSPILGYQFALYDAVGQQIYQPSVVDFLLANLTTQSVVSVANYDAFVRTNLFSYFAIIPYNAIGSATPDRYVVKKIQDRCIPQGSISSATFTDIDADTGELQGDLSWTWQQSTDWSDGTGLPTTFKLFWAANITDTSDKWQRFTQKSYSSSGTQLYSIAESTLVPFGMSYFVIQALTDAGASPNVQFVQINDVSTEYFDTAAQTAVVVSAVVVAVAAVSTATTSASGAATAAAVATTAATTTGTASTSGATGVVTATGATGSAGTSTAAGGGQTQATEGADMWMMVGQYQFLDITSQQNGTYPEGYRGFGQGFHWSNFNFGYPNAGEDQNANTDTDTQQKVAESVSRTFKRVSDVPNWHKWSPDHLLQNVCVIFALFRAALLVIYIAYSTAKATRKLPGFMRHRRARLKITSLMVRLCQTAYFALTFAALLQLKHGESSRWNILSILILIVITILLPLTNLLVVLNRRQWRRKYSVEDLKSSRTILRVDFVFKPMISEYRDHADWFGLAIFAKLLVVALCLVFLLDNRNMQSVALFVVYGAYASLLLLRPYTRSVPFLMDSMMSFADVLTVFVPVLFYADHSFMSRHSDVVGWVLLGLQGFVIVVYTRKYKLLSIFSQLQHPWLWTLSYSFGTQILISNCFCL